MHTNIHKVRPHFELMIFNLYGCVMCIGVIKKVTYILIFTVHIIIHNEFF